jgi:hypothetical protein
LVFGYPVIVPARPACTPNDDNMPLLLRICHSMLLRRGAGYTMPQHRNV